MIQKPILFLFPFAGGSSYSYLPLTSYLRESVELARIELPGRGTKTHVRLTSDMDTMVDFAFQEVLRYDLTRPFIFWGHSMGALVALLTARKLKNQQHPAPFHVILSGNGGPDSHQKRPQIYALPSEKFWAEVTKFGGVPDEVLNNDALRAYFEPILRSDFKAVDNYAHQIENPLSVQLSVWMGTDEDYTKEEAQAWAEESIFPMNLVQFRGGHFFIFQNKKQIAIELKRILTSNLVNS